MAYEAKVLADSLSQHGHRLTTLQVTFPRFVLAEFNTHRVLSRNSASSRAIPTEKKIKALYDDPVLPLHWGENKPGMQADTELSESNVDHAEHDWFLARDFAALGAVALIGGVDNLKDEKLREIIRFNKSFHAKESVSFSDIKDASVHKQVVNRLLEPFMWHTVIATATEWDNFYALRRHEDAQPEIHHAADLMRAAMDSSVPQELTDDEWHLPFSIEEERSSFPKLALAKFSVARCARVSYETHDTGTIDHQKDIKLHDTLAASGHMSPFEHVARPMTEDEYKTNKWSGNFKGWHQYRKNIPHEANYAEVLEAQENE